MKVCEACHGSGLERVIDKIKVNGRDVPITAYKKCKTCKGKGEVNGK